MNFDSFYSIFIKKFKSFIIMKKERTLKKLDLNKLTVSKLPKEQSLKIVGGSTLGGGCKTVKGDHVC